MRISKRLQYFLTLLILVVPSAVAHQDKYFVPTTVQWEISPSESLSISTTDKGRLKEIHYSWRGSIFIVPFSEIEGVGEVDLQAVEVLGSDLTGGDSYRYIRIGIGSRYCSNTQIGCVDDVRFVFKKASYESRSIYRKINETTTQIYTKLPGEKEKPGGQIQVLQ